jgi:hypothetical protein
MKILTPILLAALLTTGCQPLRQNSVDAEKRAECRARTDAAYRAQNRASRLLATDQQSTPFASGYAENPSRGLGQLYGQDRTEAECLHGLGDTSPAPASTGPAFTPARP